MELWIRSQDKIRPACAYTGRFLACFSEIMRKLRKFKRIFREPPGFRCYAFKASAVDIKKAEIADGQLVSCAETRRFAAICG